MTNPSGAHFTVPCPCGSGHDVRATDVGFSAVTVTVDACPECRNDGIVSREMRKSWAYGAAVVPAGLRHRDGLVEMTA